jgi:hypothetical protein
MYKPIVFNRHLNKKWAEEDNEKMLEKLTCVRSKVNTNCPESYLFHKHKFKRAQKYTNNCNHSLTPVKDIEVRRNNQVLVEKIMNIFSQSKDKTSKPTYNTLRE